MRFLQLTVLCLAVVLSNSLASAQDKKAEPKKKAPAATAAKAEPAKKAEKPAAKKKASEEKPQAESKDLTGWWTGTWLSHTNGHNGPINGYFTKLDDDNYCVHFNGMFWEVFPFEYNVVLTVTERKKDAVTMSGSQSLGLLFGNFSYAATVTDKDFSASFTSALDRGVFTMTRWEEEAKCSDDKASESKEEK